MLTVVPACARISTCEAFSFDGSAVTVCTGYEPPATSTTAPGAARWYARSRDLHGAASVHALESEPLDETYRSATPGSGHVAVEAVSCALPEWLPAAS